MARHTIHRVDANQPEIVAALEKAGASVVLLSQVGGGVPDLLVGFRGKNYLIELKRPGQKLRVSQKDFQSTWNGQTCVGRSWLEVCEIIGLQLPRSKGPTF